MAMPELKLQIAEHNKIYSSWQFSMVDGNKKGMLSIFIL